MGNFHHPFALFILHFPVSFRSLFHPNSNVLTHSVSATPTGKKRGKKGGIPCVSRVGSGGGGSGDLSSPCVPQIPVAFRPMTTNPASLEDHPPAPCFFADRYYSPKTYMETHTHFFLAPPFILHSFVLFFSPHLFCIFSIIPREIVRWREKRHESRH